MSKTINNLALAVDSWWLGARTSLPCMLNVQSLSSLQQSQTLTAARQKKEHEPLWNLYAGWISYTCICYLNHAYFNVI